MIRLHTIRRALAALALALPLAALAAEPEDVVFPTGQELLVPGWLWRPADAQRHPAVVMLHGCSGVYAWSDPTRGLQRLYREWGDRLVAAGYVALLVDSFTPRGAEQDQCGNGEAGVSEVEDRPHDALGARAWLAQQGFVRPQRIGLLGWSHGGSSTLATIEQTVSPSRAFRAAVAFYPGCGLHGAFGGIAGSSWAPITPVRILHASLDPLYTAGHCDTRIERAALITTVPALLRVYPGAQHSFDQATAVTGKWTAADVEARKRADALTMTWFARRLAR